MQLADQADTIFNADQASVVPTNEVAQDPSVNVLVGEGKKYKSVEDLAKAYLSADDFIEKLKEENTHLRAETEKLSKLDEVLERLEAKSGSPTPDNSGEVGANSLSASDVAAIVEKTLTGRETATSMKSNMLSADAKMKEMFGKEAQAIFEEEANTPELKQTYLQLAQVNPDKFIALFSALRATKPTGSQVDSNTSTNTINLSSVHSNRESDPDCKEYYNKMRKDNPNAYYSSKVQLALQKAVTNNKAKYYG